MEILYELEKLTHLGIEKTVFIDEATESFQLKDRYIFIIRSVAMKEFPFMVYFREEGLEGLFHISWEMLCDEEARQYIIEEVEEIKTAIRNRK